MTRIKAVKDGKEVFGVHTDLGLINGDYISEFVFGETVIKSAFTRVEADKNFHSAQIRTCHDKNVLDNHGFTDLEIIDGEA